MYLNHNGIIISAEQFTLKHDNRGLQYGDGFFESMRAAHGKLLYADLHQQRIQQTSSYLQLDLSQLALEAEVEKLLAAYPMPHARVKILFYRDSTGTYLPESDPHASSFIISCTSLPQARYDQPTQALHARIDTQDLKPIIPLSRHKTLSCTSYVLSSMKTRLYNCDEIILLNTDGNICEGCNANIFFVDTSDTLICIPLQDGRLDGVFAHVVLRQAQALGIPTQLRSVSPTQLPDFKEAFLSNVSRGIRPIHTLESVSFPSQAFSQRLALAINAQIQA